VYTCVCVCLCFFCAFLCMCVCVCVYMQVQHKPIIIYAAAQMPGVQGPHKRPIVFQILVKHIFYVNSYIAVSALSIWS
jgi:hypothetical protein